MMDIPPKVWLQMRYDDAISFPCIQPAGIHGEISGFTIHRLLQQSAAPIFAASIQGISPGNDVTIRAEGRKGTIGSRDFLDVHQQIAHLLGVNLGEMSAFSGGFRVDDISLLGLAHC